MPNRHDGLPCRDAFGGALFAWRRAYAERHLDRWYVLSADLGLCRPDDIYHRPPRTLCVVRDGDAFRRAWAERVASALSLAEPAGATAVFLAGADYRKFLVPLLALGGYRVENPLEGLSFGGQLRWLKEKVGAGPPPPVPR